MSDKTEKKRRLRWYESEPDPEPSAYVPQLTTPKQKPKIGRPLTWTVELIAIEAQALEEWIDNPKNYYLGAFCEARGYPKENLDEFSGRSPLFRSTLTRAREVQENRLVDLALTRKHDGNFTKFVLANRAGWREKTEVSGDTRNPLSFVLDAINNKTKEIVIKPDAIEDQSDGHNYD